MTKDKLNSGSIQVSVGRRHLLGRSLDGSYSFDVQWLYYQPGYEVYRQWVALNNNDPQDSRARFLKSVFPSLAQMIGALCTLSSPIRLPCRKMLAQMY